MVTICSNCTSITLERDDLGLLLRRGGSRNYRSGGVRSLLSRLLRGSAHAVLGGLVLRPAVRLLLLRLLGLLPALLAVLDPALDHEVVLVCSGVGTSANGKVAPHRPRLGLGPLVVGTVVGAVLHAAADLARAAVDVYSARVLRAGARKMARTEADETGRERSRVLRVHGLRAARERVLVRVAPGR